MMESRLYLLTSLSPVDKDLEEYNSAYHEKTHEKFARIITRFNRSLKHPARNQETELGNLCADVVADSLGLDIMLFASGSIRKQELGPIVTLKDFKECFPFDDKIFRIKLTKKQIEGAVSTFLGKELDSQFTEFYQVPKGSR